MPTLLTWWSGALVASSIDARRADLVTSCSIGHRRGSWFKERGDGQPGLVPLPSRRVPEQRAHRKFSGGSGCSPEDLPTTDFGESLDLKQPGARATEQPLTQTEEVQLERQVSNLRQSGHFHCHDDVAIRTVFENYDKRLVPHTQK
nr:uncharacterized protein LOC129386889 [Dermacentor andersoni]